MAIVILLLKTNDKKIMKRFYSLIILTAGLAIGLSSCNNAGKSGQKKDLFPLTVQVPYTLFQKQLLKNTLH